MKKAITISVGLLITLFGFQNCGQTSFSSAGANTATPQTTLVTTPNPTPTVSPCPTPTPTPTPTEDCGCDEPSKPPRELTSGPLTAAFEDLFPQTTPAHSIDYDYNDFVVAYNIVEHSSHGRMRRIDIEFKPLAHIASYDHSFLINLMGQPQHADQGFAYQTPAAFEGAAQAMLTTYDENGNVIEAQQVDPTSDITIFESTAALFPQNNKTAVETAKLSIYIADPHLHGNRERDGVDLDRYRILLYVKNTQHTLEPIHNDRNELDLVDGHPFGFIIQSDDYQIPNEGENIETVYPNFALYRQFLLARYNDPSVVGTDDEIYWYK